MSADTIEGEVSARGRRVAIVAARFNDFIVASLLKGARAAWHERGGAAADLTVVRVPGAFELPVAVVRLFNTVGPRQTGHYGMVVPRLIGQALAGETLTVYGDGHQTRCFCHVADVVAALLERAPRATRAWRPAVVAVRACPVR